MTSSWGHVSGNLRFGGGIDPGPVEPQRERSFGAVAQDLNDRSVSFRRALITMSYSFARVRLAR
jgi:hypothetical protein